MKPNFVETDTGFASTQETRELCALRGAAFGRKRLNDRTGSVATAWFIASRAKFHIIGDGPLEEEARALLSGTILIR